MPKTVDFYFDYASPYAYIASHMLAARLPGVAVTFRPVYLRGFESFSQGMPFTPAKLQYMARDLHRIFAHEGLDGRIPSQFPINGLYALRGALFAQEHGGFDAYHERLFRGAWAEDAPIGDKETVVRLAVEAGQNEAAFRAGIDDPAVKDALKAQTEQARDAGMFGVPSFLVDGELFWGHDRLDYVARAAGRPPTST